jgi:hypothetical protein
MSKALRVAVPLVALLVSAFVFANSSHAETPCDFKGVFVGDKMTPAGVMAALGVTKYKMNPKRPSWEEQEPNIHKYGVVAAGELADWDIGPYCDDRSCVIPYGVFVGNDNIAVNVFVSFRQGQITEIDVSFGEAYWDEIVPILEKKYGRNWKVERDRDMVVTDLETNRHTTMERIRLTHRTGGTNLKTHDNCQIWTTNLDIIFEHHDAHGPLHSVFVIKLVSKNF